MSKNRKIKASRSIDINSNRNPKTRENPESYFHKSPSWNFSKCDLSNLKWSLEKSNMFKDIIPKLVSFEQREWNDIISDKKHNHWICYEQLSKDAQARLNELKYYYDELFSLHLTGAMRLFGYIEDGVFYIIWYDPNHEICPSQKKHT